MSTAEHVPVHQFTHEGDRVLLLRLVAAHPSGRQMSPESNMSEVPCWLLAMRDADEDAERVIEEWEREQAKLRNADDAPTQDSEAERR